MTEYAIPPREDNEIAIRFSYHPPHGDQPERFIALRDKAREYAERIVQMTPPCREQALALTKLEEVVFWANAAIARRELTTSPQPVAP